MCNSVIKAENLGKQYRLGEIGTGSFSNDLNRWWHKVRGKEDPYLKIGEENDRGKKGDSDFVWVLKDINFEVKQGEVLGIIGRNGAGKSTLLKILSRVTGPSTGDVKVKGRIASLLEVGTGFHPDLTGKENIFLNGAILGMTKAEIKKHYDAIVAFSGVERYIDTPVKRYSSGMYVRLAFAVAAHLQSEILIVDEVLAVGDAEFQKKCLGKMKDVSGEGRTVLFVSHNMPSMRSLCSSVMIMERGRITASGHTDEMIARYLFSDLTTGTQSSGIIPPSLSLANTGEAKFKKARVLNMSGEHTSELFFKEKFSVELQLEIIKPLDNVVLSVFIVNAYGDNVLMAVENDFYKPVSFTPGLHEIRIDFDDELMPGDYSLGLDLSHFHTGSAVDSIENFSVFKVRKETAQRDMEYPWITVHGYTRPKTRWNKKLIS